MDNKQLIYIVGAIAAVLGLYFLLTRRDTVVQLPQVGQVATAPGQDTLPQELAFKSTIFSTYADYLKSETAAQQRTRQLETQANVELARIQSGTTNNANTLASNLELQRIREQGQTDRARIFADADVASAGQRSQSELARLAQQQELANRQMNQQRNRDILNGILGALGALTGNRNQQQQRGGSSGGGSGGSGQQPGTPPFNPNARTNRNVPVPRGVNPILFDPGYMPELPGFDPTDFGFGYDDWYNPFGWFDYYDNLPGYSDEPIITFPDDPGYSNDPTFGEDFWEVFGSGGGWDGSGWDWGYDGGGYGDSTGGWGWFDDYGYLEEFYYA